MNRHVALLLAAVTAFGAIVALAQGNPPIKIGLLEGQSGEIALMTLPKVHGTGLAVEDITGLAG